MLPFIPRYLHVSLPKSSQLFSFAKHMATQKMEYIIWLNMACTCKCYHQMRVIYKREWTTFCAQTSLCWWPYTGLVVHKAEQHAYMQTAVLCGRSALKCHAELHQALGDCTLLYRTAARWVQTFTVSVWTGDMQHSTCSSSVHTDMSVTITEQCMDEVRRCAVTEIAEPFVCASTSDCFQINQQYMIRLNFLKGIWIMNTPHIFFLVLLFNNIQFPTSYKSSIFDFYDTFSSWRCSIRTLRVGKYVKKFSYTHIDVCNGIN